MLHPTLRELRALPPDRPPRGLALLMALTTIAVLLAGTIALAAAAPPARDADLDARVQQMLQVPLLRCRGPAP